MRSARPALQCPPSRPGCARACWPALAALIVAAPAAAAPVRLTVVEDERLPFRAEELYEAARLRLPLAGPGDAGALHARVRALPDGSVDLTVGARDRRVDLDGRQGSEAARTVALLLVELTVAAEPAPAVAQVAPRPEPEGRARDRDGGRGWFAGLAPGVAVGGARGGAGFAPTVELGVTLGRRLSLSMAGAYGSTATADRDRTLDLAVVPLRLGVGLRFGAIEARAGALLRPYFLSGDIARDSEASSSGVQAGGWLGARATWPLRAGFELFAFTALDLVPRTVAFTFFGEQIAQLRPWALHLGLGLGWRQGG